MDGTYGNVFPTSRAMSPSASTPSGSQYKVNVSRQKTKKWANFKPQNYDGDDWGDEYDDDEPAPEPEPPLPAKPMGPRLPAGNSPTSRQFEPVSTAPPLRAHTHQFPVPPSGPSPTSGGPPRRITEPFESSSQNLAGRNPPQLVPDARRGSPVSRGSHQLPSQLPSRENSTGLDGIEDGLSGMRKSGSSPQPSGGPKPWTEGRSASPSSAGLASPNKPLPLIRPADVYQRMAEEREREQQSREASRPAEGTADTRPGDPSGLEAQMYRGGAVTQSADLPEAEDNGIGRTLNYGAGLASIPERQSEYGFDGFLASYGAEASTESPVAQGQDAEAQKSVQPVSHEDIRRYSTSPQLPNLSRMSGFGDDLFFSTSLFPGSGLRSPLSGSMQLPTSDQSIPEGDESAMAVTKAPGQSATAPTPQGVTSSTAATDASVGADAGPSPPNEPDQDRPVGLSHQPAAQPILGASQQQTPAADLAREPASSTEKQAAPLAARPQLPGGWVSETPSATAEVAASSPADHSTETLDKAVGSSSGVAAIAQPKLISSDASSRRQSEVEPAVTKKTEKERSASGSPHPASPRDSPPLPSPSPVPSITKSDMGARQATPEGVNRNASPAPGILATKTSGQAPAHTEITPTAPLNTRRGTPDSNGSSQPVLSSPFPTAPVQDPSSHSPVKDSDVLSEEIIKSLSPPQPGSSFADAAEGSTAAYQAAAADPMRESSYLGDVYGDYWSTAEDKAEPGLLIAGKSINAENVAALPPLPSGLPEANPTKPAAGTLDLSSPSPPSNATPAEDPNNEPKSALGKGGLKKQFSWEASPHGAAPATDAGPRAVSPPETEPLVEQKALGSGVENVGRLASGVSTPEAEPRPLSLAQEGEKSAEDLRAESAPEFNPAATLGSTLGLDRRVQSPSSSLDSTDRQGDDKRLSLAEEKIALQDSHPTLEPHPVFAGSQQARQAESQGAPSPKNILGFRNIMELPLPTDRIKHYNETRWQFSAVDTGLDEWVQAMMSKHPEHANEVLTHPGVAAQAQQGGQGVGLSGRGPAHLHIPPSLQHGLSGLGHSSNQVGTKGKELFMAAGKAGKGLFSKGRNKLRGTGDKVFSG
ncbi:hypothetical protein F5144DRAFT_631821 [Chaetomium tenue]|uniref:Uncharacterized protein n=1 Tax=Chaetomium tenue TaxID=1854479 RepID=A0ACB7P437_9PEZI|nr:hypothetical protein F5144DRAFT_631821 [Chaetomium globosum]